MDAREYLQQVRDQRHTWLSKQMDVEEAGQTYDLLKGAACDGMPHGEKTAEAVFTAVQRYEEIVDAYQLELARWAMLRAQAVVMLDRARAVLSDGHPHLIDLTSIEILHRYYIKGDGRRSIADEFGLSVARVDARKVGALLWLDENRGLDGMPLVPLVSE